jgi:hypothetical protein
MIRIAIVGYCGGGRWRRLPRSLDLLRNHSFRNVGDRRRRNLHSLPKAERVCVLSVDHEPLVLGNLAMLILAIRHSQDPGVGGMILDTVPVAVLGLTCQFCQ